MTKKTSKTTRVATVITPRENVWWKLSTTAACPYTYHPRDSEVHRLVHATTRGGTITHIIVLYSFKVKHRRRYVVMHKGNREMGRTFVYSPDKSCTKALAFKFMRELVNEIADHAKGRVVYDSTSKRLTNISELAAYIQDDDYIAAEIIYAFKAVQGKRYRSLPLGELPTKTRPELTMLQAASSANRVISPDKRSCRHLPLDVIRVSATGSVQLRDRDGRTYELPSYRLVITKRPRSKGR